MRTFTYVGNPSIQNIDGVEKVTGRARYVGDITVPGMLFARVLRSPLPHARIVELDVAPALAIPGVRAAITHRDFVEDGAWLSRSRRLYPDCSARCAMSATPWLPWLPIPPRLARAALEAIRVVYEPLPVIGDMGQALDDGAPLIPEASPTGQGNLCATHLVRNADPEPLLGNAPVLFEATYELPHQEHAYLETEGALAIPEPSEGVTIYANCQSPHIARDTAARVLGLETDQVRVIQPPVGGAFGGKDDGVYQTAAQAAKLALLAGRPVRLVLTRPESMAASYKRQAMRSRLSSLGLTAMAPCELLVALLPRCSPPDGRYGYRLARPCAAAGAYRYRATSVDNLLHEQWLFRLLALATSSQRRCWSWRSTSLLLERPTVEFGCSRTACARGPHDDGGSAGSPVGLAACLEWVRSGWVEKRRRMDQPGWGEAPWYGCGRHRGAASAARYLDFATARIAIDDYGHAELWPQRFGQAGLGAVSPRVEVNRMAGRCGYGQRTPPARSSTEGSAGQMTGGVTVALGPG